MTGTTMKAFTVHRYGSKDGLQAGDMPVPAVRDDDVLVQIHAAGVNPLDSKLRNVSPKSCLTTTWS